MKWLVLFFTVAVVLVYGCHTSRNSKGEQPEQAASAVDTLDIADSTEVIDTSVAILPIEEIISETVAANNLPAHIHKTIKSNSQSVRIHLIDVQPGLLKINVRHRNEYGNIRVNQIVMPDGSVDGPFGQEVEFNATQKGNYVIVVGKSNMASGSPMGDVYITIQ